MKTRIILISYVFAEQGTEVIESVDDIAAVERELVPYTYPIPTVGIKAVRQRITRVFRENGVLLFGRSGGWKYLNIDEVIERADELCEGEGR